LPAYLGVIPNHAGIAAKKLTPGSLAQKQPCRILTAGSPAQ
jgi:hypothetical protein